MEVTVGKEKAQPRGTKQWVWVPDLVFLQAKASSLNPK